MRARLLAAVAAGFLAASPAAGAATLTVAPGADLEAALAQARDGDTVLLQSGVYGEPGRGLAITTPGLTITAAPGARPELRGFVSVTAERTTLQHLTFRGPTGRINPSAANNPYGEEVQVALLADRITFADNEVTGNAYHAGVFLRNSRGTQVLRNHIHDNGLHSELDHGIYWESGSGTIAGNLIERNAAYGIHLHPAPDGVAITGNTIRANGNSAIILSEATANTTITHNVIYGNADSAIETNALTGGANTAAANIVWDNAEGPLEAPGLQETGPLIELPLFAPDLGTARLRAIR